MWKTFPELGRLAVIASWFSTVTFWKEVVCKAHLRKAAERTVEGLRKAIARILETFQSQECRNDFAAAGYDPTRSDDALV